MPQPLQRGAPHMDSAKYIGLDVHKESISIAVLNAAGKIVMESVIETTATLILQFLRGLRGDLHVTFEEGTSAAWLYDLIQPHVAEVVVCDPRQNALVGLSRRAWRTSSEGIGAQLSDHQQGSGTGHDPGESAVPQLGHSLHRQAGLFAAPSCRMAGEDHRTRRASPPGV